VWSKVLGIEKVGIQDNFFSIGGDSIKSIQISSRIRSEGYKLTVQDIFTSQIIEKLALKLKEEKIISNQSLVLGQSLLTPIQQWHFDGPIKHKHHYNMSVMLNFPGGLSAEVVHRIFRKLQEHHDALRMVFRENKDAMMQMNLGTELPVSIEEIDLKKGIDKPGQEILTLSSKLQSSLELVRGPLMKLGLYHLEDGSRLLIVVHHLIMDGISWRILFEDIETLYHQVIQGDKLDLP
jgi:aryl carrier-like protein